MHSWVYFEGEHLAHYENNGVYYVYGNQVGTAGVVTDWTGAVIQDELHYPWGKVWTTMGTQTEERFASLHHRDSATNLDPTHFRMYSSDEGRWLTPDPAGRGSANPYSPQSWNRNSYLMGNPFNYNDPYGLGNRSQFWTGVKYVVGGGLAIVGALTGADEAAAAIGGAAYLFAGLTAGTGTGYVVWGSVDIGLSISNSVTNSQFNSFNSIGEAILTPTGLAATAFSGGNISYGQAASTGWNLGTGSVDLLNASSASHLTVGTASSLYELTNQITAEPEDDTSWDPGCPVNPGGDPFGQNPFC